MFILQLTFKTSGRDELLDITSKINESLKKAEEKNGFVLVFVPHTTAGILINEGFDSTVADDILEQLDRIVPWQNNYKHAEGNSAAHIKSTLVGSDLQVPVEDNKLLLGRWQKIFLAEFDGPRTRQVYLKFFSEK
ncbi:MAG: secondary thiamine-phosphate synthase enzyme YjbQ [Bacillota bacterium]